jgi:hypothetical protein
MAQKPSITIDRQENTSDGDVNWCRVFPAWINKIDGNATPANVPAKNGPNGTSRIGEQTLINQLGSIGVIRKNIINQNKLSAWVWTRFCQSVIRSWKYFNKICRPNNCERR